MRIREKNSKNERDREGQRERRREKITQVRERTYINLQRERE